MPRPAAPVERADGIGVWMSIVGMDEPAHAAPFALDQNHSVLRHGADDCRVKHLSLFVAVNGEVIGPWSVDHAVAIVVQDRVDFAAADPELAAAEHEAVTVAILAGQRQSDDLAGQSP